MFNVWGERIGGAAAIAFGLYMASLSYNYPVGGHMFPLFSTGAMIVLGAVMIGTSIVRPQDYSHAALPDWDWSSLKPIMMTALTIGYFALVFRLGYFVSTLVFLLIMPYVLGLRAHLSIILCAVLSVSFIYVIFELALRSRLPSGILM